MFGKGFELFKLFGFSVKLDLSWFLIAILVTWSLAVGYFPQLYEGLAQPIYWLMGAIGALGLFAAIVVHELSHSLMARRNGMEMSGITLFIFGGVAEMSEEPPGAAEELKVSLAGPLASVGIAGLCFGLAAVGRALSWPVAVVGVIQYLAVINVVVVVFNMLPAFPLDGGRVLRSLLWRWKGDLRTATRWAATVGSAFGILLIMLAVLSVLAGNFIGGMWLFLIGLFLRHAAQQSYQRVMIRRALEGEPVRRFMQSDPVSVPRAASVRQLVEEYVYRYHHKLYPVEDRGRLVGCVTTRAVRELPKDEWERQSVGAIAEECDSSNTIGPDSDAMDALSTMQQQNVSRLIVVDGGELVGVLALKDLLQFFALKMELEKA